MRRILSPIIAVIVASLPAARTPAQTLETETARLLHRGWWKAGGAFEAQTSSDDRDATGAGDIELT